MGYYCDLINTAIEAEKYGEVSRTLENGQVIDLTKGQWWNWLASVNLLIVDEIGTGLVNEWRVEMLWRILECRAGKPLLLTGNIGLNTIGEQFDERIQSRIVDGSPIEVVGHDLRRIGLERRVRRVKV